MKENLTVVFGRPGAGKDQAVEVFKQAGYRGYDADDFLPPSYLDTLKRGEMPTDDQRRDFLRTVIEDIKVIGEADVVVNFVFTTEELRQMLLDSFPTAQFILVHADRETISQRLNDKPREGHVVDTSLALAIGDAFETPQIPHNVVTNNGTIEQLREQIRKFV